VAAQQVPLLESLRLKLEAETLEALETAAAAMAAEAVSNLTLYTDYYLGK
jgi:hypothetical protein